MTTLSAVVVQYIRDVFIPENADNMEALASMQMRLENELVHNPALGIKKNGAIQRNFRNDVLVLTCIINALGTGAEPTCYNPELDIYVLDHIGTDMDDDEFSEKCTRYAVMKKADTARTKISRQDVYDLILGRCLARLAYKRVSEFSYTITELTDDTTASKNMATLLNGLAKECIFDATGDTFLHMYLRLHLCAERLARLVHTESPTRELARQVTGDATNDLVVPAIKTRASDRTDAIDWETSTSLIDFVFAVTLLLEYVGNSNLSVYMNTEIPYMTSDIPQLFLLSANFTPFSSGFGMLRKGGLEVLPMTSTYQIPTLLLMLAKQRCVETDASSYKHLVDCCERPDEITRTNPFYAKLYGGEQDDGF